MAGSILPKSFSSDLKFQESRKQRAIHFLMVGFQLKSRRQLISIVVFCFFFLKRYRAFTQPILGQKYLHHYTLNQVFGVRHCEAEEKQSLR